MSARCMAATRWKAAVRTTCGAVIISGAAHFMIEGAAVARKGDRTDHGGVLEEGDAGWMLD